MAAYGFQGLESLTGPGMQFHYLASLEQEIFFGLELRPFKCEGWRTVVYICRANEFSLRSPRDTRDFRKGRSIAGKLTCTHSFRGGAAKKKTIQHSHANIPPARQTTKISFKG